MASDQDLYNYWGSCIVLYKGEPHRVVAVSGGRFHIVSCLGDSVVMVVPFEALDTRFPHLGWVKVGNEWLYLYRQPLRKIRKGYCQETLGVLNILGSTSRVEYNRTSVIQQLYKKQRKNPEILSLPDGRVYYGTELVMQQGGVEVAGKEKLSGYIKTQLGALYENYR